jgi:membrane fusion protein (multidrug efflux system)
MTYPKNIYNMKSTLYSRLLVALSMTIFLAACSASSNDNKEARLKELKKKQSEISGEIKKLEDEIAKANPNKKEARAKDVAVSDLAARKFDYYVETQGSVESENNIIVSPETAGVVTQVFVTEGQQVSKGQVLAQVDNSAMVRNIESMKAQLELATSVYNRQKNLWDQKIGTEVQYLQAKTSKESLEKQIASMEEQNSKSRIKSPIDGVIDQVAIKAGESVSPGILSGGFRIVNNNNLKLVASVSEAYVTNIKKGNKVVVSIPELNKDITTTVSFVGRNINSLSRTFAVEAKLQSLPDLRPNMTATIKVIFDTKNNAIVVPVNVIQTLNDEKIVYIAETKGNKTVARKKTVKVDGVYGNEANVEGLNAGDKIVTFGYQGLNDGDPIKI